MRPSMDDDEYQLSWDFRDIKAGAGGYDLTRSIAAKYDIDPANIVLGNGSDDIV